MNKNLKESSDNQFSNITTKINQSFSLIGKLFSQLTPRNEQETKIIQTIVQNLRVVKSGITQVVNSKNSIEPENLVAPKEKPKTTGDIVQPQMEMSSAAAGAVIGTVGNKKKILDEDEQIKEAKENFRKLIKESIVQLYEQNPSFLDEESMPMEMSQENEEVFDPANSTGAKILNDVFGNVRQSIDKSLERLLTSKNQRNSFKQNLLSILETELNKLNEEKPVEIAGQQTGQPKISKEELKKYMIPGSEPTGFAQASEVMVSCWTSIKDAYTNLGDPRDKKVFLDGIMENTSLLCDEKEKEISKKYNQTMTNNKPGLENNAAQNAQTDANQSRTVQNSVNSEDNSLKSLLKSQ